MNNTNKGNKGNCTPEYAAQSLAASGFTVGGDAPQMLGRDGKADPKDDLEGHPGPNLDNNTGMDSPDSADEALAEFTKLGSGPKFSSLQGGGKTSLPTGEENTRENKRPHGRSGD